MSTSAARVNREEGDVPRRYDDDDGGKATAGAWHPREGLVLLGSLAATFAAFQIHLRTLLISDMDEGTYLYAGQLISRGLTPYRDFLLAHPPLIALFGTVCVRVFGPSIMAARIVYLVLILASTIPLYALVRKLTACQRAALLAVASYTCGMLVVANMGRTVRLEPLANAFVIAGFACRFLRDRSPAWMAAMGFFFAGALFVKATAVIPTAFLLAADLMWDRPWWPLFKRWLTAGAGATLLLVPGLTWCLSQPRFVHDVLVGQALRPRLGLGIRLQYLTQNVTRFPVILIGLVAAAVLIAKSRDARIKSLALVALGGTLVLVFAFKTFFNYYIVQMMPWIGCMFAITLEAAGVTWLGRRWPLVAAIAIAGLAFVLPSAYAEIYERTASAHVAGPRTIISKLKRDGGYLYSMFPAFAIWGERPIYAWYYQADSLVGRINGWIGDADFLQVFGASTALVLYPGELDTYPAAREYVERNFVREYQDADWTLWLRTSNPDHREPGQRP